MNLLNTLKNVFTSFLEESHTDWWVEINTKDFICNYYFEDFQNINEAKAACSGYIDQLKSEGAQGIKVTIKRC
jgi:hypothetical protein